jgi:hypothetical protein
MAALPGQGRHGTCHTQEIRYRAAICTPHRRFTATTETGGGTVPHASRSPPAAPEPEPPRPGPVTVRRCRVLTRRHEYTASSRRTPLPAEPARPHPVTVAGPRCTSGVPGISLTQICAATRSHADTRGPRAHSGFRSR